MQDVYHQQYFEDIACKCFGDVSQAESREQTCSYQACRSLSTQICKRIEVGGGGGGEGGGEGGGREGGGRGEGGEGK